MIKFIFQIVGVLFFIFLGSTFLLYLYQRSLIFFPQKTLKTNKTKFSDYETFINHKNVKLHGWFIRNNVSSKTPLIIYYGGNAEDISHNLFEFKKINTNSFLLMNYRGYGESQGKATQENLYQDALFIIDYITQNHNIPLQNIMLMGRSLGSGVAVYVAKHRKIKGVILVTPFDSLVNIAKLHYPIFPVKYLLKDKFESITMAKHINIPMINIMASNDGIVPNYNSLNLMKHWAGYKQSVTINNANHINITSFPLYWKTINTFLANMGKISIVR